ncbi:MAG: ribulose-phosphate 3-epimerase [Phycisphaerae bacterium]|nr:ribulose-phosphate 3-epimerase [Phycisphaerae bacterium]
MSALSHLFDPNSPTPARIAPSVLDADFGRLAAEIAAVEDGGCEVIHLDVMDGHFVPNLSIGVPVVAAVQKNSKCFLDAHLMIAEPRRYAAAFAKAGAHSLTFHAETVAPADREKLIGHIRGLGCRVGIALNPATPADAVFDTIPLVDIILVMTVWPGFGGQKFIADCLPKIEAIAKRLRHGQWLQVDGGINLDTARVAAAAGANSLVAGSAIYRSGDAREAFRQLQHAAREAQSGGGPRQR